MSEEAKKAAALSALRFVPESGVVGLGTGSTAKHFIDAIGELVRSGRKLSAVPTSEQSRAQAEALGIPLEPADGPWVIDVCVDGADEVSDALDLIKGGGGAHTREKIVNEASALNVIVVDESKLSHQLGEKWSVPVEVLAFAHSATARALGLFGEVTQRQRNGGPWRTDSGNYVYDVAAGVLEDPWALDVELRSVPGVVETGLFCGRADVVLVAGASGVRELRRGG
ncbi:MAG TPA: ribose-5-phosphate isomerase RpiA [Polyangiaceae bacterium]|nr:ribose-5-phosphate isomerase RpiA [Polyangiaceae bacterium]